MSFFLSASEMIIFIGMSSTYQNQCAVQQPEIAIVVAHKMYRALLPVDILYQQPTLYCKICSWLRVRSDSHNSIEISPEWLPWWYRWAIFPVRITTTEMFSWTPQIWPVSDDWIPDLADHMRYRYIIFATDCVLIGQLLFKVRSVSHYSIEISPESLHWR